MVEKPCCAASAVRRTKRIEINGMQIGLYQLEEVMAEVRSLRLEDEDAIGDALLKRIMVFNYVPPKAAPEYRKALVREFMERDHAPL